MVWEEEDVVDEVIMVKHIPQVVEDSILNVEANLGMTDIVGVTFEDAKSMLMIIPKTQS